MHEYSDEQIRTLYKMFVMAEELNIPRRQLCEKIGMTYNRFFHLRDRFVKESYRFKPYWAKVAGGELHIKKDNGVDFDKIFDFLEIEVINND
jgi:hypothetical protein